MHKKMCLFNYFQNTKFTDYRDWIKGFQSDMSQSPKSSYKQTCRFKVSEINLYILFLTKAAIVFVIFGEGNNVNKDSSP